MLTFRNGLRPRGIPRLAHPPPQHKDPNSQHGRCHSENPGRLNSLLAFTADGGQSCPPKSETGWIPSSADRKPLSWTVKGGGCQASQPIWTLRVRQHQDRFPFGSARSPGLSQGGLKERAPQNRVRGRGLLFGGRASGFLGCWHSGAEADPRKLPG